ncbi:MAG: hypothetical protein ACI910_001217 [Oleispira sp.]|jgi:hypothetical protein
MQKQMREEIHSKRANVAYQAHIFAWYSLDLTLTHVIKF